MAPPSLRIVKCLPPVIVILVVGLLPTRVSSEVAASFRTEGTNDTDLGLPCQYNRTGTSPYSVQVYLGNRQITVDEEVPHGSVLRFHCPIQRYYRLVGVNTVKCNDGVFDQKLPHCEAVLLSNRLTAIVDTEYVLGPGGEYVVFPGSQVRMSCYHALSRSYRPSWQWDGKVDHVFIEERVSFGQVTVIVKFEAKNNTDATFTCSDTTDDIHVKVVSRSLHCPPMTVSSGLQVTQTSWLRADFECPPESILLGASSANCMQFRLWDVPPPICAYYGCEKRKLKDDGTQDDGHLIPCQLPQLSAHLVAYARTSKVNSHEVVPHGTDVIFHCRNPGRAQRIGESEIRCINGNWTAAPPVCAIPEKSTLKGVILDFDFSYRFGETDVLYVDPQTDVVIKCISPTKLMPTLNYTVIDELSPVFIINAEAEDSTAVAKIVSFNTGPKFDAEFVCATNETNEVFEARSIRLATKEARCGDFEPREGLRYRIENTVAVFSCDKRSALIGHATLRCVKGNWDHAQPICVFQERCKGWRESVPTPIERQTPANSEKRSETASTEPKPNTKEYVVRAHEVVTGNLTDFSQLEKQPLDAALPPLKEPPASPKRRADSAATPSADGDEDEDEDSAEEEEELKQLAQEVDQDDENDIEDPDDEEPRPIGPLNPYGFSTTPSSVAVQCPKENGLFAHPSDCRRFLHCSSGVARVMHCPLRLIFSPSAQICKNYDDDVGCYSDE